MSFTPGFSKILFLISALGVLNACKPSLLNDARLNTLVIGGLDYTGYPAGTNPVNKIEAYINSLPGAPTVGTTLSTPSVSGTFSIIPAISGDVNFDPTTGWLNFNTSTGAITTRTLSPTTAVALQTYTISVNTSQGVRNQYVTIQVIDSSSPPLTLTYAPNPVYVVRGTAISLTTNPGFTGGAPNLYGSTPSLPAALALGTNTGVISGNPSAAQTLTSYVINGSNGGGSANFTLQLAVFEPPTKLALSGPTTGLVGDCLAYTVTVQDASSTATNVIANRAITLGGASGGTFYSDSGCTTSTGTSINVAQAASSVTFYYSKPAIGTPTLTVASSGLTGASQGVLISTAPNKLVYTAAPTTGLVTDCLLYTVQVQDVSSVAANVLSDRTVNLADGSNGGFYSNAGCTTSLGGSLTITTGTSSGSFYYQKPTAGTVTLTSSSSGISSAVQSGVLISTLATKLVYTAAPTTGLTTDCLLYTVQVQDASSAAANVLSNRTVGLADGSNGGFYSNAGCTTSLGGSLTITTGNSTANFYYQKPTIGTVTITASSSSPYSITSATQSGILISTLATKLVYTANPTSGLTTDCLLYTVQVQDAASAAANVLSTRTINLADGSNGGFYSNAGCTTSIGTSFTIAAGSSSGSFYYQKPTAGTVTITASSTSPYSITSATQSGVLISTLATKLVYTANPTTGLVTDCLLYTVQVQDAASAAANVLSTRTINLSDGSNGGFYSNAGCTTSIGTSFTIAAGSNSGSFYYQKPTAGTVTITSASTVPYAITSAVQSGVLISTAPTKVVLTAAPTTGLTTDCLLYTVQVQDAASAAANVLSTRTITLGGAGTGGGFYSNAGCTTSIGTSFNITTGNNNGNFYYQKTSPGTPTLTVASTSPTTLTGASVGVTITVGAPTLVTFTGSSSITTASCAPYTATTTDSLGNASPLGSTQTVTLTGILDGSFYSDPICTASIASTSITTGNSAVTVYYKKPTTGSPTLSAAVATVNTGTKSVTVGVSTAAKLSIAFVTSAPYDTTTCVQFTVSSLDAANNPVNVTSNTTATLAGPAATTFYTDACVTAGNPVILSGTQSISGYFKKTTTGAGLTFTASKSGLLTATSATYAITAGPPNKFFWSTAPTPVQAYDNLRWDGAANPLTSNCYTYTVQIRDVNNNATSDPTNPTQVNLTGAGTNGAFYANADTTCTGAPITFITIPAATQTGSFKYRNAGSVATTVTFTATDNAAVYTSATTSTITVTAGQPTQLVASTAATAVVSGTNCPSCAAASICGAFTVQVRDAGNAVVPSGKPPAWTLNLSNGTGSLPLTPPTTNGAFYTSQANCTAQTSAITSIANANGTNSVNFWYRKNTVDTAPAAQSLKVGYDSGGTYTGNTSNITASTGNVTQIVYSSAPTTGTATGSGCSSATAFTLQLRDENNQNVVVPATKQVDITISDGSDGTFFSDSGCTANAAMPYVATIAAGSGASSPRYYRKPTALNPTVITTNATNWLTQTKTTNDNISAAVTPSFSITGPASITNGSTGTTYTFTTSDSSNPSGVVLSTTGSTGVAFYVDAACTLAISTVTFSGGSATAYVCGAIVESSTLNISKSGYTAGTKAITVN